MKGLKTVNMNRILAELNEMKASAKQMNNPDFIHASLSENGSWTVKANFAGAKIYRSETFSVDNIAELFSKYSEYPKLPMILDDMLMNCDIYLPTLWIYLEGKNTVKRFIDIIASGDEIEYMNEYKDLFDQCFGESETDVLSKEPVLLDFFHHYKILTNDELLERYKDQRFFNTRC